MRKSNFQAFFEIPSVSFSNGLLFLYISRYLDKSLKRLPMIFGERIKELRESKGLLQRQIAASLDMDTPNFSKIERGERKAKREQIKTLSRLLDGNEEELLILWLADKVSEVLKNENVAVQVLHVVINDLRNKRKDSGNQ
jgi:transcriptional regulator with XRE-family HTH domain